MKKTSKTGVVEKPKTLVLLDSHAILHRGYHALPEFTTSAGRPTGALYGLSLMIISLVEKFKPDYILAAYDLPEKTNRHKLYESYKAGRRKIDDALAEQLAEAPKLFEAFNIPLYKMPGYEADDMIGTICEKLKGSPINIIIASGDMDTMQLIDKDRVKVFTLKKGLKDTVLYNEEAVIERYGFTPQQIPDFKGLRGDPSDNIIGIAGVGEKTATTIIQNFETIERMYAVLDGKDKDVHGNKGEEAFKKAGLSDRIIGLIKDNRDEALFSKALATITTDAPVEVNLPEKRIAEDINPEAVSAYFKTLEFRTLADRVKTVFGKLNPNFVDESASKKEDLEMQIDPGSSKTKKSAGEKKTKKKKGDDEVGGNEDDELEDEMERASEPFKKAAIGMWLLDSNKYNPLDADILAYTKTENAKDATQSIEERIKTNDLSFVYNNIEIPLIPIVDSMEKIGVKIDIEYMKKLSKDYHADLDKIEKKIWKLAGKEFNIASPKQLGEVLFDDLKLGEGMKGLKKTSGGARSTKESELEKLKDVHEIIPLVQEYRELAKLLGTYIDTIPLKVDENNRLHTHFMQAGTTTGRMASTGPNLQNIPVKTPRGKAIRNAFIPEKGKVLITIDYSQFELRIAAFLSGDEKLISIFKQGQDVHAAVASEVFQVPMEQVTSDMRRKAKVINFGILYGMGVNALRQNLGGTRDEAKEFYDAYFNRFTALASYLEDVKRNVAKIGYTTTFFGRKRFFPGIKSPLPFIRASAERMAINAPIQGTQADLIKIAMKKVDELFEKKKLKENNQAHLLLQVHDELVYEIDQKVAEELLPEIKHAMEDLMDEKDRKGVPIIANVSEGKNWGSMEKVL